MKNKKCTILISALIAFVGAVGFGVLQFRLYELLGLYGGTQFLSDLRQFAMVITSGLFTSAMVTLLISISEYRNERVEALEGMYLAAMDLEREFSKIKYFLPDEPKELIQNVLGELDNNDFGSKYNENLATSVMNFQDQQKADDAYEKYHMELKHDAQMKFRDYIWEHTDEREKAVLTEPFQKKDFLDRACAEKIEKYDEQLKETMKSFLRFQEVRTSAITAAYGRMDFIFANKSIRLNVYEKLYRKLFDTVNLIKKRNSHFDMFLREGVEIEPINVKLYGNCRVNFSARMKIIITASLILILLRRWCKFWFMRMAKSIRVSFRRLKIMNCIPSRDIFIRCRRNGKKKTMQIIKIE